MDRNTGMAGLGDPFSLNTENEFFCFTSGEEEYVGFLYTKKNARQIIATMMLQQLSLQGYRIPKKYSNPRAFNKLMERAGMPAYSYVVLLKALCDEFRLDPVQYEMMADPVCHLSFTVKVRVGYVERVATATSKRVAYQLAAEAMYRHLRSRLKSGFDFNEEEAMTRAYSRTMTQLDEEKTCVCGGHRGQMGEKAARKPQKSRAGKKNRQSSAVEDAIRMELEQTDELERYEAAQAIPVPGPSRAPEQDCDDTQKGDGTVVSVQLLHLTMERLDI